MSTRSPRSVSSLAAQPPEIPDPTTIASKLSDCCAIRRESSTNAIAVDRRARACGSPTLEGLDAEARVGVFPRLGEFLFDRGRVPLLRQERLPEAEERAAVLRVACQVVAERLLRFREALRAEERRAERLTSGVEPVGWLVVAERVLGLDGCSP